jgi:hypothetical protein
MTWFAVGAAMVLPPVAGSLPRPSRQSYRTGPTCGSVCRAAHTGCFSKSIDPCTRLASGPTTGVGIGLTSALGRYLGRYLPSCRFLPNTSFRCFPKLSRCPSLLAHNGIVEVSGSIPLGSTKTKPPQRAIARGFSFCRVGKASRAARPDRPDRMQECVDFRLQPFAVHRQLRGGAQYL